MKKTPCIPLFAVALYATFFCWSAAQGGELVAWNSPEGIKRLERSDAKMDFFVLANRFQSQKNKLYCGLASAAIVLNALRENDPALSPPLDDVVAPKYTRYLPKDFEPSFFRYGQENILTSGVKTRAAIFGKTEKKKRGKAPDYGLQLEQLAKLLRKNGARATAHPMTDDIKQGDVRRDLAADMRDPSGFVLVNYLRSSLGQKGAGHISPLGAYDKKSDSFLILDVNPEVAPWMWADTADLVAAMRTFDVAQRRGYVIVQQRTYPYNEK
ncbi:MAG: phytochelatin synthase family protein [Rickettsiales bacterium]